MDRSAAATLRVAALRLAAVWAATERPETAYQEKQRERDPRLSASAAAIEGSRLRRRPRPILMTSFAFLFGALPLLLDTGSGAEMRQALGTAGSFGTLG
jgi:multidrug efflux pump subunit AcrB